MGEVLKFQPKTQIKEEEKKPYTFGPDFHQCTINITDQEADKVIEALKPFNQTYETVDDTYWSMQTASTKSELHANAYNVFCETTRYHYGNVFQFAGMVVDGLRGDEYAKSAQINITESSEPIHMAIKAHCQDHITYLSRLDDELERHKKTTVKVGITLLSVGLALGLTIGTFIL